MNLDLAITFTFRTNAAKPPLDAVLAENGVIEIKRNWLFDDMPQEYEITYEISTISDMARLAERMRVEPAAFVCAFASLYGERDALRISRIEHFLEWAEGFGNGAQTHP